MVGIGQMIAIMVGSEVVLRRGDQCEKCVMEAVMIFRIRNWLANDDLWRKPTMMSLEKTNESYLGENMSQ